MIVVAEVEVFVVVAVAVVLRGEDSVADEAAAAVVVSVEEIVAVVEVFVEAQDIKR